ncbi:MAG: acylphosphatase [Coriobacteriia bacterium]|nr:acylphosphatase [Coriobacteriia bacterium]
MERVRYRVVIEGRVQGVWFRESTRRMAEEFGVEGWVRNLPGGSRVEAVFEGEALAVARAIEWAHRGPEHAVVTALVEFPEEPEGLAGFEIRR